MGLDEISDDSDSEVVIVGDVRTRESTVLSFQSIDGLVCSSQGIPRIMV